MSLVLGLFLGLDLRDGEASSAANFFGRSKRKHGESLETAFGA